MKLRTRVFAGFVALGVATGIIAVAEPAQSFTVVMNQTYHTPMVNGPNPQPFCLVVHALRNNLPVGAPPNYPHANGAGVAKKSNPDDPGCYHPNPTIRVCTVGVFNVFGTVANGNKVCTVFYSDTKYSFGLGFPVIGQWLSVESSNGSQVYDLDAASI